MERRGVEVEHALGLIEADRACIRYVREPSMREHHQHFMQVPKFSQAPNSDSTDSNCQRGKDQRHQVPSAKSQPNNFQNFKDHVHQLQKRQFQK